MNVETHIEKREQKYRAHITNYNKPLPVKNAARAAVSTVREDVLESGDEEWRHDWIVRFIERERALFRAQTPDDLDDRYRLDDEEDEETVELRDTPLCACGSRQCRLKQGDLPTTVRTADSLAAGVQQFRREHSGDPVVLTEALEAWRERMAHVADVLEVAIMALGHEVHVLEIDGAEELIGDTSGIPEPEADGEEAAEA